MIDPSTLNDKVETLNALLRRKLNLRGKTLEARLSRGGGSLPKHLKKSAQVIVQAQRQAAHPKLALRIDRVPVEAAFADLTRHLKAIDPAERRKTKVVQWLAGQVFNLILVVILVIVILRWRGIV